MKDTSIPVFSGQGSLSIFSPKARAVAAKDSSSPTGSIFLDAVHHAFIEELSSLTAEERSKSGVTLSDFPIPKSLLEPKEKYQTNAIIQGTTLCLFQLLRYLSYVENTPDLKFENLPSKFLEVSGFCSGSLPAAVVASSRTIVNFLSNSLETFKLSFWIGYRCELFRIAESVPEEKELLSWGLVIFGWTREVALDRIKVFNAEQTGIPLHLTAVTAEKVVTISGRGDLLARFQVEEVAGSCSSRFTSVHTLYHGGETLQNVKSQLMNDLLRRNIQFPSLSQATIPLRSTVDGRLLSSSTCSDKSLLEIVVDQVLIDCVNWDKTVGAMITNATGKAEQSDDELVTVVNFGPGTGSVFQAQKPPHPRIRLLDLSHTSDAANTFVNKKPLRFKPEDGIAIVGMGVNMPGATDPNELWKLLEEGLNTVSEIPSNRFNVSQFYDPSGNSNKPKRSMGTKFGNFIENPDAFDNNFFNISPREAKSLDPQQRVLLQTAYSAIENAGYVADSTDTFSRETFGCYVGVATGDYVENLRNEIDVYYSTGTLRAFLSGRISYALKLTGPSLVIDTACSSSLVAIYQACRALENGDCNAAVAGGVNVITSPDMYLGLDRAHFLSPTGQCKAFDQSADGYCRSEGCGMFVLKRLSDAIAENDQILGVIRGVQVNQSGEAHSITHPHAATQQRLFKRLLEETGIDPLDVSVIEAHGTGTQAGDPIELESLRGTFAKNRTPDKPLHITSIKSNIGHLEAASGSAGLAKLLLMLRNTTIPKQVSLRNLNPKIAPLGEDGVQITRSNLPWKPHKEGAQRLAMLNNFGAAGANGVLLLEEAPARLEVTIPLSRKSYLFAVTAKTKNALESLRVKYLNYLKEKFDTLSLEDVCYTATARRQPFNHRIAVTVSSFDDLISQLEKATPIQVTPKKKDTSKTVFVFSGQGSQYLGMGRGLIESSPLFRELVEYAHYSLVSLGFVGVLQVINAAEGEEIALSEKEKVEAFQCSIFVLEYALAKLWTSVGVQPDAVLGHSLGEYAALAISEVLSFEDALKIVANRARMMAYNCELKASGMLAVNAPPEKVEEILMSRSDVPNLAVACRNSTADCVIAGPIQELDSFRAYLKDNAIAKNAKLNVPFGYHSAAMDPIREPLTALAATVKINPPKIITGSNVFGRSIGPQDIDSEYFAKHARQPVRFAEEIQDIVSLPGFSGSVRYIEIGPHPISLPMLRSTLGTTAGTFIPSMHKTKDPWVSLSESLATLFLAGFPAKWREVFAGTSGKTIDLPSYPFSDNKYWVNYEETDIEPIKTKAEPMNTVINTGYSMVATCLQRPSEGIPGIFETPITNLASFISGHNVGGSSLCPASVYHELAMASARFGVPENVACLHTLGKVRYCHPLVYEDGSDKMVRITLSVDSLTGDSAFEVSSYRGESSTGRVHCSGEIKQTPKVSIEHKFHRKALKLEHSKVTIFYSNGREGPETIHTRMLYEVIFPRVVSYSKPYQTVRTITIDQTGTEGFAVVQMPAGYKKGKYVVHPVFMDTLLHAAGFIANSGVTADDACICNEIGQAKILYDEIDYDDTFGVYCNLVYVPKEATFIADAYAMNSAGKIVGSIKGMNFKKLKLAKFRSLLASATGKRIQTNPIPALSPTQRPLTPVSREPSPPPMDIAGEVAKVVASTCGVPIDGITPSTEMESLGVDSLMIFEIADKLKSTFNSLKMESSELAACHTVQDLEDAIRNNLPTLSRPVSKPAIHTGKQCPAPDVITPPPEQAALDIKGFLEAILGVNAGDMQPNTELESLGLDSLTSIEVLHSLKSSIGLDISPDTFAECRTVLELEVLITSNTPTPANSLPASPIENTTKSEPVADENNQLAKILQMTSLPVSLQRRDGANSSLFLIHDGSGLCSYYGRLSSLNRSVWGLYNPRFFSQEQWTGGLVEMATAYTSYIQQTTSEPYILGGWSYGGVVAFEAGRQLLQAGKKVTGVVLIDSPCPINHQGLPSEVIAAVSKSTQSGPGSRQKIEQLIKSQFEANTRNLVNYNPAPSDKNPKLILLRSREGFSTRSLNCQSHAWLEDKSDPSAATAGWEELVGSRVPVIDIPGNHFEPFDNKNVHAVSASLSEACRILEG
ncbi:ketoacyl-synt-domain-containing protein [Choiromyces venosus 120613-1]|uniref:Ketoacyl-synt-domain-containing protein n=1 Tax=Choiromyces venosus 120613-1 TaxID=1336337 RepID=A0A3N4K105_9PEZI|nr:ketoacyl-synt-domain-containing protein [Choiromyces venosus 120613-1]